MNFTTQRTSQLARSDENGDIFRRAVQELCHLCSKQPGREVFRRPGRHRRLCHVVRHTSVIFGHRNSTSYPVRPATHPALRAGLGGRPCRVPSISQLPQSFGVLSVSELSAWRLMSNIVELKPRKPDRQTMPAPTEAVISQMLLITGSPVTLASFASPTVLCPVIFATRPFYN